LAAYVTAGAADTFSVYGPPGAAPTSSQAASGAADVHDTAIAVCGGAP
jgi:hypothetical protein